MSAGIHEAGTGTVGEHKIEVDQKECDCWTEENSVRSTG